MPERFSWVIDEMLAGMERPGLFRGLDTDLEFLHEQGVEVIINLEEPEHRQDYEGFLVKYIPILDFGPPSPEDFKEFVGFVDEKITDGNRVAVHCYAGMGRTNVMIASYLIHYLSIDPMLALNTVRTKRPVHMVNYQQTEALSEYYKLIKE